MDNTSTRSRTPYDAAFTVVTFLTLYQGVVPVVVRLFFDGNQRLAPVWWLPAPWWWIAALAIVVAGAILLSLISQAKTRRFSPRDPTQDETPREVNTRLYDGLSGLVFLVGLYNGVAPFVVRLVLDGDTLLLALPLRLPSPWWWITSIAVMVVAVILLAVIDQAKQRRQPPS